MLVERVGLHHHRDRHFRRARHAGFFRLERHHAVADRRVVRARGRHAVHVVRRRLVARHPVQDDGQAARGVQRHRERDLAVGLRRAHVGDHHRRRSVVVLDRADTHLAVGDGDVVRHLRADRHGEGLVALVEHVARDRHGDRMFGFARLAGRGRVGGHEGHGIAASRVVRVRDRHVVHAGVGVIPGRPVDRDLPTAGIVQADREHDLAGLLHGHGIGDRRRRRIVVVHDVRAGRIGRAAPVARGVFVDDRGGDRAVHFVQHVVVGRHGERRHRLTGREFNRHGCLGNRGAGLHDRHHHGHGKGRVDLPPAGTSNGVEDPLEREHHVLALGRRRGVRHDRDLDIRSQRRRGHRSGRVALAGVVHRAHLERVRRTCDRAVTPKATVHQVVNRVPTGGGAAGDVHPVASVDTHLVARGVTTAIGREPGQRHLVVTRNCLQIPGYAGQIRIDRRRDNAAIVGTVVVGDRDAARGPRTDIVAGHRSHGRGHDAVILHRHVVCGGHGKRCRRRARREVHRRGRVRYDGTGLLDLDRHREFIVPERIVPMEGEHGIRALHDLAVGARHRNPDVVDDDETLVVVDPEHGRVRIAHGVVRTSHHRRGDIAVGFFVLVVDGLHHELGGQIPRREFDHRGRVGDHVAGFHDVDLHGQGRSGLRARQGEGRGSALFQPETEAAGGHVGGDGDTAGRRNDRIVVVVDRDHGRVGAARRVARSRHHRRGDDAVRLVHVVVLGRHAQHGGGIAVRELHGRRRGAVDHVPRFRYADVHRQGARRIRPGERELRGGPFVHRRGHQRDCHGAHAGDHRIVVVCYRDHGRIGRARRVARPRRHRGRDDAGVFVDAVVVGRNAQRGRGCAVREVHRRGRGAVDHVPRLRHRDVHRQGARRIGPGEREFRSRALADRGVARGNGYRGCRRPGFIVVQHRIVSGILPGSVRRAVVGIVVDDADFDPAVGLVNRVVLGLHDHVHATNTNTCRNRDAIRQRLGREIARAAARVQRDRDLLPDGAASVDPERGRGAFRDGPVRLIDIHGRNGSVRIAIELLRLGRRADARGREHGRKKAETTSQRAVERVDAIAYACHIRRGVIHVHALLGAYAYSSHVAGQPCCWGVSDPALEGVRTGLVRDGPTRWPPCAGKAPGTAPHVQTTNRRKPPSKTASTPQSDCSTMRLSS